MRLLKEPLLHFLLIGVVLFVAYSFFGPSEEAPRDVIVVDAATVESLDAAFEAVWKRPPTQAERRGLIDDHLAEEVLYREAQKLGLDRDDVVIRRRLRQKMEFLLQDSLELAPPEDAALRAFFAAETARYRDPDRRSFQQVFLGSETSTANTQEWQALAAQLNGPQPPDPESLGVPSLLPARMELATPTEVERMFGREFAAAMADLESGRWSGPLASTYGWHLVRLDAVQPGAAPSFEEAREQVLRDYIYQRQLDAKADLVERLKQNYDIVIEEDAR